MHSYKYLNSISRHDLINDLLLLLFFVLFCFYFFFDGNMQEMADLLEFWMFTPQSAEVSFLWDESSLHEPLQFI